MTGEDHNTDALIAALRSPALPAEQVGEAAAVTAMLEALGRVPAPSVLRVRRGIAIAVVTVASLGVGGLAAAGPGVFTSAANRARSLVTPESGPEHDDGGVTGDDSKHGSSSGDPTAPGTVPGALLNALDDPAGARAENGRSGDEGTAPVVCVDGTHGDTVSAVAHATLPPDVADRGAIVSPAAQSECGQTNNADGLGDGNANGADNGNGPPTSFPNGPATGQDNGAGPPISLPIGIGADNGNGPPTSPPISLPNGPATGQDNGAGRSGVTPPTPTAPPDNGNAPSTSLPNGPATGQDSGAGRSGETPPIPTAPPGIGNAENGDDDGIGNSNGLGDAIGVGTGNVTGHGIATGQNTTTVPDDASTNGAGNRTVQNG